MKLENSFYNEETKLQYELDNKKIYIPIISREYKCDYTVGKYGRLHAEYLRTKDESYYNHLLLSEKLYEHLVEVDKKAKREIKQIVNQLAINEKCDNVLKNEDPIKWNGLMLNYLKCAEEIVLKEVIYAQ